MKAAKRAGILHMGIHKSWVIQQVRANGAKEVIGNWTGTDEEAIAAIQSDPRDYFDGCDNTDETGRCQGHRR